MRDFLSADWVKKTDKENQKKRSSRVKRTGEIVVIIDIEKVWVITVIWHEQEVQERGELIVRFIRREDKHIL